MATRKRKVKDTESGEEFEIEYEEDDKDDDDDDDDDEDEDNIYLTEKDLRWLKEQRKGSGGSRSSNGQTDKNSQKKSGIAVKKKTQQKPAQSRVKKLSLR
jgi:hypothetical protein